MPIRSPHAGVLLLATTLGSCGFDTSGVDFSGEAADAAVSNPADAFLPQGPDATPAPTAFAKTITLEGSKLAGDLDDFPVYIELTDADLQARATANGGDIYFVNRGTASALDHEIQRWDDQRGHLEAWVKLAHLTGGVDHEIEIHYGDPSQTVSQNPSGVWSNGFAAVWHLEQSPSGGQGALVDSLANHPGTGIGGMGNGNLVSTTLGKGLLFDGNDDEITFSNPLSGSSPHTISAWVNQAQTNDNDALVVLGNGACGEARWFHSKYTGGAVAVGFYCDDVTGGPKIQNQGPTLLHWTYDANADTRIYRDGALDLGPVTQAGTQSTNGTDGYIGNAPAAFGQNMGLNGVVDEVRIATVARSAAWIQTEFANQSAPDSFYTVGAERPLN